MLVSFTFENWRSFRDANTLNLVATAEKQHGERVPEIKEYDFRLLSTAAIYGGNASGKSNLFKAMQFAKWMISEGPTVKGGIPVDSFRLDVLQSKSSRFGFVILIQDENGQEQSYDYSFSVNRFKVLEEKLVWIKKRSEVVLFERQDGKPSEFDKTITQDRNLHAVLESTRDNQLYLTNAASQNTSKYKSDRILRIFHWFLSLVLITPEAKAPIGLISKENDLFNKTLALLGTGITRLAFEDVPLSSLAFTPDELENLKIRVNADSKQEVILLRDDDLPFYVSNKNDELLVKRLLSVHMGSDAQTEFPFELNDDSDGTVRIIDLLPLFLDAATKGSRRVVMIDELDRSLHTLLVRQLLESYLASCSPESRSQIIFTTHDVLQMDQNLLRRDEMWVTDRKNDGSTELVPLSSFKEIRKDKSIRTSYLRGQLGGTPKLLLSGAFPQEVVKEAK